MITKEKLMQWKPSTEQLQSVECYLVSIAYHKIVAGIVEETKLSELKANDYRFSTEHIAKYKDHPRLKVPADGIIRKPCDECFMEGLSECAKQEDSEMNTSFGYGKFHNAVDTALKAKGVKDGINAECIASTLKINAEKKMVDLLAKDLLEMDGELISWGIKEQFVDLLCRMLTPKCDKKRIEITSQALFVDKLTMPEQTDEEAKLASTAWLTMQGLYEPVMKVG